MPPEWNPAWLAAGVVQVIVSALLTYMVRNYLVRLQIMDKPSERGMHKVPTPRGGGLAIVAIVLISLVLLRLLGYLDNRTFFAFFIGGGAIAAVSFRDDQVSLPAKVRYLVQAGGCALALALLGGLDTLDLGFTKLTMGPVGNVVAVIAMTWTVNLYNFMDGIDGLTGSEAVTVGLFSAVVLLAHHQTGLGLLGGSIAMGALGFLFFNWPPAKIFMGDVGSTFLGFTFATLAVAGMKAGVGFWFWPLVLGVFFVDTTVTLICRILNKEKFTEPHRTHAFQVGTKRMGGKHVRMTLLVVAVNLLVLFPIAQDAISHPDRAAYEGGGILLLLAVAVLWTRGGMRGVNR
ncbi:MraY family glycosyltransferase [Fimbriimonas ginsengisoli]|uniref:Glycosyl transferase, group 4 family protein n=1 Tax=Fimbriimonas ginsengisoli Gsoil 348 TaxID=661478 RepID=A0A068NT86_FIMGI|nr:glycosyltransferase family 4 protein [Fimbriimonas ginsengisoli]AIE86631.1 glycosyl transferase, group 4 family protein [Fimbriimonas ginsengisoli Gsoil 348]